MLRLNIAITTLVVVITAMVSIMLHQIEHVDLFFWYIITIPVIALRLIRTITLINIK